MGAIGSLPSPRGGARPSPPAIQTPTTPRSSGSWRSSAVSTIRHDPAAGSRNGLLEGRPQALVEAVEILIRRPEAVRAVLTRFGYTDPDSIGGYLDRDL